MGLLYVVRCYFPAGVSQHKIHPSETEIPSPNENLMHTTQILEPYIVGGDFTL